MKHGKMIKMVATGTGARKVVIGWVAPSWSLRISPAGPAASQCGKASVCRLSATPAGAHVRDCCEVGMQIVRRWGGGVSTTLRIKGTLLSLLDPTKAHVSDTLQVLISALEWTGRICDLIGWGLGSSREGVSTSLTPLQAWPILAFRLNLSHQINKAIVRS
jgi:hypothetical protein